MLQKQSGRKRSILKENFPVERRTAYIPTYYKSIKKVFWENGFFKNQCYIFASS